MRATFLNSVLAKKMKTNINKNMVDGLGVSIMSHLLTSINDDRLSSYNTSQMYEGTLNASVDSMPEQKLSGKFNVNKTSNLS